MKKRLYRCPEHGKIGGVCHGLAEYFETDPVLMRLIMLATFFISGPLIYIIAWLIIPTKESLQ